MTSEFDGVRELSIDEVDAVAGGPAPLVVFVSIGAAAVAVAGVGYVAGRVNGYNANRQDDYRLRRTRSHSHFRRCRLQHRIW